LESRKGGLVLVESPGVEGSFRKDPVLVSALKAEA